ncbi:SRPBCC family protein [Nocardioides dilutus]
MNTVPLEVTTHIAAPPEVVWLYLTDPARYAVWMGTEVTLSPTPGGLYKVHMREGIEARGEFVELDPPHRLVFTWGWQDHPVVPPGSTTVEVTLEATDEGTLVRLTHRGLPDPESVAHHRQGWENYLPRLAIAATGGAPGPDPNADMTL